jgi:transcriptional regulator with XRE-family HTH domain
VENGHTIPALDTLERIAKALDLELYQLFYSGSGKPVAPEATAPAQDSVTRDEKKLLQMFRRLSAPNKELVLGLARQAARK